MFGECLCGRHELYGYGLCLGNVCVVKAMVCVWGMSVW